MGVPGNGHTKTTVNCLKCCSSGACCGASSLSNSLNNFRQQQNFFQDYENNNPVSRHHIYVNPINRDDFITVLNATEYLTLLCEKDIENNNNQLIEFHRQHLLLPHPLHNYIGGTVGGISGAGNSSSGWNNNNINNNKQQNSVARRYQVAAIETAKKLSCDTKETKQKRKTPGKARMRGASGRRELEDDPLMRRPRRQLKNDSPKKKQRKKLVSTLVLLLLVLFTTYLFHMVHIMLIDEGDVTFINVLLYYKAMMPFE